MCDLGHFRFKRKSLQETKHSVGENVRIVRLEYGNVGTVGVILIAAMF